VRLSPEINLRGEPSSLSDAGAAPGISDTWTHQRAWSRRGRRTWRMIIRFPGNLGDLAASIVLPAGDPAYQLQDDPRLPSRACGDESRTNRWYRQAKETKCGEMDGKESECPIVASKRGNGPYRTPWSEGDASLWTQRRNHAEGIVPPSVSPQGNGPCEGQRHNVTSRMPLTGTSGSVGGLGGQPPRSTRPAGLKNQSDPAGLLTPPETRRISDSSAYGYSL
jgi:hypothetical protein